MFVVGSIESVILFADKRYNQLLLGPRAGHLPGWRLFSCLSWALQIQNMLLFGLSSVFGSQTTFLYNRIHEVWSDKAAGIVRVSLITYTSQLTNSINDVSSLFNGQEATEWALFRGSGRTCVFPRTPLPCLRSLFLLLASTQPLAAQRASLAFRTFVNSYHTHHPVCQSVHWPA